MSARALLGLFARRRLASLAGPCSLSVGALLAGGGCWQLTGVSDFTVQEAPACKPPAGSPCQVVPNCGCADGETCRPVDVDAVGECVADGAAGAGEACAKAADCGHGLTCLGGACAAFCATNAECGGAACLGYTLGGAPVAGVGVCGAP